MSSIDLKGLDDTGVIAFMESAAGHGLDDAGVVLAHQVYRETDGNPFFVAEMLRNLAESGRIYQDVARDAGRHRHRRPAGSSPQRADGHRDPGLTPRGRRHQGPVDGVGDRTRLRPRPPC